MDRPAEEPSFQHDTAQLGITNLWVILLAAGEGTRVRELTRDREGEFAPKQFSTPDGCQSMLGWAIERAAGLVPYERIVPIVAAQHRQWWEKDLARVPTDNVVIQPDNRGTAPGILLPLLRILRRDPLATVLILPSDHYVRREQHLRRAMVRALHVVHADASRIVLIGVPPQASDTEYGWILPASPRSEVSTVAAFVEKPERDTARDLMRGGAIVNTCIIVAKGNAFYQRYLRLLPSLVGEFATWREVTAESASGLAALYQRLATRDFSRDVLQPSTERLSVVRASGCGWLDLGTRRRLQRYQNEHPARRADHRRSARKATEV